MSWKAIIMINHATIDTITTIILAPGMAADTTVSTV